MRIKRFNESVSKSKLEDSIDYLMESLLDFNEKISLYKYYVDEDGDHYADYSSGNEFLLDGDSYMIAYNITIETQFIPKTREEENFDATPIEFSFHDIYDDVKDLSSTFDFTKSFLSDLDDVEYCVGFYNDNIILKIIDLKSKFKYEYKKV